MFGRKAEQVASPPAAQVDLGSDVIVRWGVAPWRWVADSPERNTNVEIPHGLGCAPLKVLVAPVEHEEIVQAWPTDADSRTFIARARIGRDQDVRKVPDNGANERCVWFAWLAVGVKR